MTAWTICGHCPTTHSIWQLLTHHMEAQTANLQGGGGDSDLASRGTWNRLKGGRRERYYHHLPPHTQKGTQTQGASKEEHGQSDTDDAKPG